MVQFIAECKRSQLRNISRVFASESGPLEARVVRRMSYRIRQPEKQEIVLIRSVIQEKWCLIHHSRPCIRMTSIFVLDFGSYNKKTIRTFLETAMSWFFSSVGGRIV
ncbi:hypothetical protein J6590_051595 [Homalodisca vitripennis]|nr:hypothetical protein J6590_051595 [Homalodisca vitripennis]